MTTARHQWCTDRITGSHLDVDEIVAKAFMDSEQVSSKFTSLFSGDGPKKLFVTLNGDSEGSGGTSPSPLVLSDGSSSRGLPQGKCCYFLRCGKDSVPLEATLSDDSNLLFGEMSLNALAGVYSVLGGLLKPLCQQHPGWKDTEKAQRTEFLGETDRFTKALQDGLHLLVGGLVLKVGVSDTILNSDIDGDVQSFSPDAVSQYEMLLEGWHNQAMQYLEAASPPGAATLAATTTTSGGTTNGKEIQNITADVGPRRELQYWRNRMQRLSSISGQMKRKECKAVIAALSTICRSDDQSTQRISAQLRRWKQMDIDITEAAVEAKDNIKYLVTLERFIEPLYSGTPVTILDTLLALMNSIKMIYTISRYYNTTERLTSLFTKITDQMIENCKHHILNLVKKVGGGGDANGGLWEAPLQELVPRLRACLKLNSAYQEHYHVTKAKFVETTQGKQFECDERVIFGHFDLFCRRLVKLIDLFTTVDQFKALGQNKLEGMDELTERFNSILQGFQKKKHVLLHFHCNNFDRDYVEFIVNISNLEESLKEFINDSFENITSIEHSLQLLHKFQSIFQRDNLKSDLDSKLNIIFQTYGMELEQVQRLYERQKTDPPIPRNQPPVAGNIMWSRHLLQRIEEPMRQFESNPNVLAGKDAKRIIKMYNRIARTLVAFEYLWFEAWVKTIDQAKAGLQATLIIRHPDDGKLYVNFDQEIMQLIREAKCLGSMGLDIPESAKIVLFQEEKFKRYYDNLNWALTKYDTIVMKVIPMTALVLRPHFNNLEYKLRPGMITLTWTSMNIEAYQNQVHADLNMLDEFISNINDIIENRIEKNLGIASKVLLIDLPLERTFNIQEFLDVQRAHIGACGKLIEDKNIEIFGAVEDLVKLIQNYPLDEHLDCGVSEEEVDKIRKQFNHFMCQALVHCAINSIDALKSRIQALNDEEEKAKNDMALVSSSIQKPFFDVDIQLEPQAVANLMPSLHDIQECTNKCTQAILDCFMRVKEWTGDATFFNRVANDEATTHAVYRFNECVQDINNAVNRYILQSFGEYDWLWKEDKDASYKQFTEKDPTLDDYEDQLRTFNKTEDVIDQISGENRFGGAISLNTSMLKAQLKQECMLWKNKYCQNLHAQTQNDLDGLTEYIRVTTGKLRKEVSDLDSLRFIMNILKEVRARESGIDKEINGILNMYQMLEYHLGSDFIDKEEIDQKTVIRAGWTRLIRLAESRADELSKAQDSLKRNLTKNIRSFSQDVVNFRKDFISHGPMQNGLTLSDAIDRLSRFKEECKIRERKFDLYRGGEELFTLAKTEYPELDVTVREVGLCDQLFGLYGSMMEAVGEWKEVPWESVATNIDNMIESMDNFAARSKKLPSRVKDWEACKQLYNEVDKVSTILPIIQELSKESIMSRHWEEVMKVTGSQLEIGDPNFKLQNLLDINIADYKDELLEITEGADKQLKIHQGLQEITDKWGKEQFVFSEWKSRGILVLMSTGMVMEELEEAQLNLQTMLSMRHVAPFREEAQNTLQLLSDTSDVFERWLKVQIMWCSLESVFTGGDIAKQMPTEAKKFSRVDKDWAKLMQKANGTSVITECCANQALRSSLPTMYTELEKCQKSLEGYLEQKRSKFPRFYFVSNPGLLMILSQGSDPVTMNQHYEKVFDAIATVSHNPEDKHVIEAFNGQGGGAESINFSQPIHARGNIEDWLCDLLQSMQLSMKNLTRICAANILSVSKDISGLWGFVDGSVSQMALLGIQLLWTADVQLALEKCQSKKNAMKECNAKQLKILQEMSSWCLQDLGTKTNRTKVESLVTIHVHQRDVINDLVALYRQKRISDANDFEWLKQARFYWQPTAADDVNNEGACVVSITDVDFSYQYEYLGSKERLVITPLTDRCYITLAQALGMYFGGAPAGPAGTGKTETVKDLGRTLGLYVVVTNCTDQQKYTDCAKIFKGLCQGGLWGCFDEFNRILLPVLSVVAQQVLAIQNAKKAGVEHFYFPGDSQQILLKPVCGFFITMNPGYAGRQELPENLKSLFRGVAMMVPDFQIIMKVRLCSVGYTDFELLAQKFFVLYITCKEQLSAQKHYDWGLRNILSVLRTAGETKRENVDKPESFLLYRTLRDMNLSKLVAQDVPLFLSLLADLFPTVATPPKRVYGVVEEALKEIVEKENLVHHSDWVAKIVQLYETTLVRHGIMLVGPTGGGKTMIFRCLRKALEATTGIVHKEARFNPKSIRAPEMYGEIDPLSGEWNTGVFAAMWAKFNNRSNSYNTWIIADGPVDAIWIEDLNTVLDDNKILTLANGDRIPMTENVKAMFEVESLVNASPATVSRTGIIYVSDTDLDWGPVVEAWVCSRRADHQSVLSKLFSKWMGDCTPSSPGHLIKFLVCSTKQVMQASRVGLCMGLCDLLGALIDACINTRAPVDKFISIGLERLFLFALAWSVGGLLEFEDRVKFDEWLRKHDSARGMPAVMEGETLYEYVVDVVTLDWKRWVPPQWSYPDTEVLDFSNLLIPTVDSTRALYLLRTLHKMRRPVIMVGAEGTAKTSTATMFFRELDPATDMVKCVNFSSATTPFMCQNAIEQELEKRGGKTFGPPANKKMTIFIDDLSMPEINAWGDQPTLEMVRLMVEWGGFHFLDKEKRGSFKVCKDLQYVAAMRHPGGGKNDIPNRLKRNVFNFNLVLPSMTSINDIYGQMLTGRFSGDDSFNGEFMTIVDGLKEATIKLWRMIKVKMLPTPTKFHYIFNMRDLSRVFQGILLTPKASLTSEQVLVDLWRHECSRVFCDKLATNKDKSAFNQVLDDVGRKAFGDRGVEGSKNEFLMANFMRDAVYNEDGVLVEEAPKVYEPGGSLKNIRTRVQSFMDAHNADFPSKKLELVLFDDALKHLLRLNRLLETPRGSALLVGVGGSGKQSLTRLASYISRAKCFQPTLTKIYNTASFMDDLRLLYKSAGHQLNQTVFLFTEKEIKDEVFLELINSVLTTGEVPGLFAKDEMMAMTSDLRPSFLQNRPGLEETRDNLKQYFIDSVRDNLHLVLCMSPLNPMFAVRARKFPGLISGPTIDWFLPWPADALLSVSTGLIGDFKMGCSDDVKSSLMNHMGFVHRTTTEVCDEYYLKMRRQVHQTPKSYLAFITLYKEMYTNKLEELQVKEGRLKLGLDKLIQGAEDVEAMKLVLAEEQSKLEVATKETTKMLESLEVSSAEAKKEGDQVSTIKHKCEEDAVRIAEEKRACEVDLAKAQPYVDQADAAISSIKPAHIQEVKKLPNPADIIKLVMDCVLLLFMQPVHPIKCFKLSMAKKDVEFIESSFKPHGFACMSDPNFLKNVVTFGQLGKDKMNEETIEFLLPYMELENFQPSVAKNASAAAEGLCTWVQAMTHYHEASKIVKPKLSALIIAENQMKAANEALHTAENRLHACQERLNELQGLFDVQMAEKQRIEDGAIALSQKMNQASQLINGLAGERARWMEDSKKSNELKNCLVGNCALASAFVSYCGPFNQEFRHHLIVNKFTADLQINNIPVTLGLDIIPFLVDIGTIGDWNIQGLPTDPLSIQNGILVTRSSRFPLMIDPQGQADRWIRNRESQNMPIWGTTTLNDSKLRDKLEFCMGNGKALIILGVENDIDPVMDPVLEKQIVYRGRRMSIVVGDKSMDYDPGFSIYFITRLPNPVFSPELQAKVTLVDFTVTQKGLEEQLLGRVIGKEQQAIEEQLSNVLEEVNSNTKALLALDASLLERLTSNAGNLLEDEHLVGVLASTKATAAEVNQKLQAADETRISINEKREQFRPIATRGSVLYFSMVEMSLVNVMYQTSLNQFLTLFTGSMDRAEKASLASKRVSNIIETMTYMVYRYVNRGLYEKDKLGFVLLVTIKILITAQLLRPSGLSLFLRGGSALDMNNVRKNPFSWMSNESWLNTVALSQSIKFFSGLLGDMCANESAWQRWYEDNEPENIALPNYESTLLDQSDTGPFYKLLLVRSLRMDRTILTCKEFIRKTAEMGPAYVEPVTDTIEMIYDEMVAEVPVIFLLSVGADPTESVEVLARRRKIPSPEIVSLGEGQGPVAKRAMEAAAANGTWVLLQNCELGLDLMVEMEDYLMKLRTSGMEPGFRLFITALPHPQFPLGLLHMSTKVTNEPPSGLKAGILRSYTVIVDQDRLERVETPQWRQLLFVLCFLHSVVQERRKFGPLGWSIPYEYNNGDLSACILFLEKHLYNGPISWSTFTYMVSEVQYGGKITDDLDRRLFRTYSEAWLTPRTCDDDFTYSPASPIQRISGDFKYIVPNGDQISVFKDYIHTLPEVDSPEIFGLHPNADLTFRVKEANALFSKLGDTQPKGGEGSGGASREDEVYDKAAELLSRLPEDYVEETYRSRLKTLGGLTVPLNIFLFQEIQRFQFVIGKVRYILSQLQLAIKGEVVMSEELQSSLDSLYDAQVPNLWTYTIAGDEFSWIIPSLGLWFSSLVDRDAQYRLWLSSGRPNSYWLTGFFNPQGMLTAMKQEVMRKHRADKWALDDVVYHTAVTTHEHVDQIRAPPSEGVYIHGLFLDGASWSNKDGSIIESLPKKLFVNMPVLHVSANIKMDQVKTVRKMFGPIGPYICPCYKYAYRTDRHRIFFINLKCTADHPPSHWGLRGIAIVCNT